MFLINNWALQGEEIRASDPKSHLFCFVSILYKRMGKDFKKESTETMRLGHHFGSVLALPLSHVYPFAYRYVALYLVLELLLSRMQYFLCPKFRVQFNFYMFQHNQWLSIKLVYYIKIWYIDYVQKRRLDF